MEETAKKFFDACESGKGWERTKEYVESEDSTFEAQVTNALPFPKLSEVKTIKGYTEWMAGVAEALKEKATFEVKGYGFDSERKVALFYAVFGGASDYVYTINFGASGKIKGMRKIWNDGYAKEHPF